MGTALISLVVLAALPPVQVKIVQQSSGWCSPNIANVTGNVTVNCIGVDPHALQAMNAELDRKKLQLADKIREANQWTERYKLLEARLSQAGDDTAQSRKAEEYLHAGDLENAGKILDQLLDPEERGVDRVAANHFNRALIFELQFRPLDALPHLEKAYQYRPYELRYAGEYGRALINQKDFQHAEPVCRATLDRARELAKQNPSAHQGDVAHALNQLGSLYLQTNRFEDARAALQEAFNTYSQGGSSGSRTYLPQMAEVAVELASLYAQSHWFEGAEKADELALNAYRQLAQQDPAAYQVEIATTLNSLAVVYGQTQRMKEAQATGEEALAIRQKLAKQNPAAYDADVAQTLSALAYIYRQTKQAEKAESACKESLEIYGRLAKANPDVYESYLPTNLKALGRIYSDTKRTREAEASYLEALDLSRKLGKANPGADHGDVADTLNDLGLLYQATQRPREAEASYHEAMEDYAPLVKANQNAYLPAFASTLNNLAGLYRATGRAQEAEAKYQLLLNMRRHMAQANPVYQPELAETLHTLGLLYNDSHRTKEAEASFLEALDIRSKLAHSNPIYFVYAAQTLTSLSGLYGSTQRPKEAQETYLEALTALAEYKVAVSPESAEAHYNLGTAHMNQGNIDSAVQDFTEAIRLKPNYAEAIASRGSAFERRSDYERAIQDFDQAIRLKPDYVEAIATRGFANYYLARFPLAIRDYQRSLELNPSLPYVVLWLHLAKKRIGENDALELFLRAAKLDANQWPAPVVKFYLGQITSDQLLAAAPNSDPEKDNGQRCEANFYLAEDSLLHQDPARATARFQTALDICPKNFVEHMGAVAELKGLDNGSQLTKKQR